MIIYMGREIIHAACNINELPVGKALTHFFDGAMYITKMWLNLFNGLSIQRDHQVQYTMCCRMLRSYIDDQITFGCCAYFFKHMNIDQGTRNVEF